jgi:hypothetical protein
MWLRRLIVVFTLLLSVGLVFVVRSGLGANTRSQSTSFFANAAGVSRAYKKALGPTMLVIRIVIEETTVAADILVDPRHVQRFVLDRDVGYVVASTKQPVDHPEPGKIAYAMTLINFRDVPAAVTKAAPALGLEDGAIPTRLVIERPEGESELRWRVFAGPERYTDVTPNG